MKKVLLGAAAVGLIGIGFAIAQTISIPVVTGVAPSDLFQDVVGGVPTAQNQYASAAQISGVTKAVYGGTITTDPAYTFANGVVIWSGHKASTLTTGTITTEPNPPDQKRECFVLDQTTSTLTWTANTGQTIGANVPTAGVANVPSCIWYKASVATWYAGD